MADVSDSFDGESLFGVEQIPDILRGEYDSVIDERTDRICNGFGKVVLAGAGILANEYFRKNVTGMDGIDRADIVTAAIAVWGVFNLLKAAVEDYALEQFEINNPDETPAPRNPVRPLRLRVERMLGLGQ